MPHRKQVRHFDEQGDFHELTFSCYRRWPLLTNDVWRTLLARSLDASLTAEGGGLSAFVFMPEHVHLIVYPLGLGGWAGGLPQLLAGIKRPCSAQVKARLQEAHSSLLGRLTIRERPGRSVFRFWQEGPGYDRNLKTARAVLQAIDYLHLNPVRRGLCEEAATGVGRVLAGCHWHLASAEPPQTLPSADCRGAVANGKAEVPRQDGTGDTPVAPGSLSAAPCILTQPPRS